MRLLDQRFYRDPAASQRVLFGGREWRLVSSWLSSPANERRARELETGLCGRNLELRPRGLVPRDFISRWMRAQDRVWVGTNGAIKVGQAMVLCDSVGLSPNLPSTALLDLHSGFWRQQRRD